VIDNGRESVLSGARKLTSLILLFLSCWPPWQTKTEEALQHVLPGNEAINMLFFRFLGVFPGCVVLKGAFERCPEEERQAVEKKYNTPAPGLSSETIKVLPLLCAFYYSRRSPSDE
jgi:hypothetical protein